MLHDAHNHFHKEGHAEHLERIAACARELGVADRVVNGTRETDWPLVHSLA